MSKFGKLNWQEEISKAILAASQGYANWNMYKATEVDKKLTTKSGLTLKYDGKNWKDSKGNIYTGVDYNSTVGDFTYTGKKSVSSTSTSSSKTSSSTSTSTKKKNISIGSRVRANGVLFLKKRYFIFMLILMAEAARASTMQMTQFIR